MSKRKSLWMSLVLICGSVVGCDSDSQLITRTDNGLEVAIPSQLREIQAISSFNLLLQVSVDGVVVRNVPVAGDTGPVNVDINLPIDTSADLSLSWFAIVNGNNVLLSSYSETIVPTRDNITVTNYLSSGAGFDFDGDGRSNLAEAKDNRNMLSEFDLDVPFSTASFLPANVRIGQDRITSNNSGDTVENDAETRFSVWHNGTDLKLYLCGQDQTLSETSAEYWHDDTIFVFIDGQDSDSATYDGVDDYQIAFIRSDESLKVSKGSGNPGCPNGDCITYNFSAGTSSCQYELTASFPLASMNMTVGEKFGFDVEYTDDDNGGLRENSASWIGYDDSSDVDPRTFGTARLLN